MQILHKNAKWHPNGISYKYCLSWMEGKEGGGGVFSASLIRYVFFLGGRDIFLLFYLQTDPVRLLTSTSPLSSGI